MTGMHTVNQKKQRKYIVSYNIEEKNDWYAHSKPKKAKKVHRFLQYGRKKKWLMCTFKKKKQRNYIDSYNMEEKNDWCVHCKPKKIKKVHRFLQYGRKNWLMCMLWTKKKKEATKVHRFLRVRCKQKNKESKKKQRFNQQIISTPHLI